MVAKTAKSRGAKKPTKLRPVLVTTEHRGVFFGYEESRKGNTITLRNARCCIRWSSTVKGFLGLAATGPDASCRIGPAAPQIELLKVTSVSAVSDDAVKAWEAAPWVR